MAMQMKQMEEMQKMMQQQQMMMQMMMSQNMNQSQTMSQTNNPQEIKSSKSEFSVPYSPLKKLDNQATQDLGTPSRKGNVAPMPPAMPPAKTAPEYAKPEPTNIFNPPNPNATGMNFSSNVVRPGSQHSGK